jgi:hypothetical protein
LSKKPKENQSSKRQVEAFRKVARELGCDEDPKAFERTFSKVVPAKHPKAKVERKPVKRQSGTRRDAG